MRQRLNFLSASLKKTLAREGLSCPSCGCSRSSLIARKYVVAALRRCEACQLLFRTPTTSADESASFYQGTYSQGFTTDCPSDPLLSNYLATGFGTTGKDYASYLDVIMAARGVKGGTLFDFGCSWGYGSWQFEQAGFQVESFEISVPRATYAREKLGIKVHTDLPHPSPDFDVFFSSHVLEHVPSVGEAIAYGMSSLKPGGLFVAFTPNGSLDYRTRDRDSWHRAWGMVHPNLLDPQYYRMAFRHNPLLVASNPYPADSIREWARSPEEATVLDFTGGELVALVVK